ncbi:nicotinamide-nucleotide amidohydrolase family protein [Variovorax sp. RKNM96]|uniref:CinA family protein n=1 Tax=Variovorax sp. RKNM96 TaxID=2681552 RepID=UPI001AF8B766|nr:CinA family protein [Variovorax sp. RKNM96]QSI31862.1 nicotinamide-nucleotide amidohydrolase family protein [Variovorax sp. RKNM96]
MSAAPSPGLEPLSVLAARVGETLRERRQTVAVAESSAGGLVSAALLAIPGASAFFLGGAVVYSRRAGKALLGLTREDMGDMRGETEPYARFIAARIRESHRATWGICESGAAGPSGSPYGDAPGRVCLAVAGGSGSAAESRTVETGGNDRPMNMTLFARHLLALFDEILHAESS